MNQVDPEITGAIVNLITSTDVAKWRLEPTRREFGYSRGTEYLWSITSAAATINGSSVTVTFEQARLPDCHGNLTDSFVRAFRIALSAPNFTTYIPDNEDSSYVLSWNWNGLNKNTPFFAPLHEYWERITEFDRQRRITETQRKHEAEKAAVMAWASGNMNGEF